MFYTIIVFWVVLDLFTKNLAMQYLQNQINLIWDFLFFKYSINTWIAFSTQVPFYKIWTIILIFFTFYYYIKERKIEKNKKLLDLVFWLILAGAIWNWIERIFKWEVIDFIWVKYFSIFNLADMFISIGIIIYIIYLLWVFDHKKEKLQK